MRLPSDRFLVWLLPLLAAGQECAQPDTSTCLLTQQQQFQNCACRYTWDSECNAPVGVTTHCVGEDDELPASGTDDIAARLAALEAWQQTLLQGMTMTTIDGVPTLTFSVPVRMESGLELGFPEVDARRLAADEDADAADVFRVKRFAGGQTTFSIDAKGTCALVKPASILLFLARPELAAPPALYV